ncbi:MAG: hypothetical protein WAV27_22460, partial [Xanthobacteraceae bacterium]
HGDDNARVGRAAFDIEIVLHRGARKLPEHGWNRRQRTVTGSEPSLLHLLYVARSASAKSTCHGHTRKRVNRQQAPAPHPIRGINCRARRILGLAQRPLWRVTH